MVLRRQLESGQYTSFDYTQTLADHVVLASVGSVGDAYDNALAESFVDSFKTELIADRVWRSRNQLELAVVEYLGWFNNDRIQPGARRRPTGRVRNTLAPADRDDHTHHDQIGNHLTRSPQKPGRLSASPLPRLQLRAFLGGQLDRDSKRRRHNHTFPHYTRINASRH